jgi:hypothetical protein
MTTYTAIPDTSIDPDSPLNEALFTLLRDNPIAQTEGSSGASKTQTAALEQSGGSEAVTNTCIRDNTIQLGDKVNTAIGSASSVAIADNTRWTPSAGFYNWTVAGASDAAMYIEIFVSGGWRQSGIGQGGGGFMWFDGTNMRIYNNTGISRTAYYQKLI